MKAGSTIAYVSGGALLLLVWFSASTAGNTMDGVGQLMSGDMWGGGAADVLFMLLFWGLVITWIVGLVLLIVDQMRR
jgi:hypothetical protein